jgi:hypothetical protein
MGAGDVAMTDKATSNPARLTDLESCKAIGSADQDGLS